MKYWLACFGFFLISPLHAKDNFPKSCKPLVIKGETFSIDGKKPVLVLITNRTQNDLWLSQEPPKGEEGSSWSGHIEEKKWTALFVSKQNYKLSCIESKPGHEQAIPCEAAIAACQFTKVKKPKTLLEPFWSKDNLSLATLLDQIGESGFKW